MNYKLIQDMFYAAPEFWVILGIVILFMISFFYSKILKLKRKKYFLNRDRERFVEMLYALKDGYFSFIYPDKRINDYRRGVRERCSRRLAVMLNLKNGVNSSFSDVLENFYKDDAKKIQKYLNLLRDEGVAFEDSFNLKGINSYITLAGMRINGYDGNVYCDVIWFRDISSETKKILSLEEEKSTDQNKLLQFETFINGLPYPAFLRNEKLDIVIKNKKYSELISSLGETADGNSGLSPQNIALLAQSTNKVQKYDINPVINGEQRHYCLVETPCYQGENLEKICTVGALIDTGELDALKRNLKLHQNIHLQVLSMLGTAFGVFDKDYRLSFYNEAFLQIWKLDQIYLDSKPTYANFLDVLREKRQLPEVPDFKGYKNEELQEFDKLIENKEDLMHLPDGRTLRRVRAPQPSGGLIFAFEDVSDRLATRRAYNLQQETLAQLLNNLPSAALIFGSNGHLKHYNKSYVEMWKADEDILKQGPLLPDIIDMQKSFFANTENWEQLRRFIVDKILSNAYETVRKDGLEIEARCASLPDDSVLIIYKKR